MKKYLKILATIGLLLAALVVILEPNNVYASIEQREQEAKNESKSTLTENVKKLILDNSEQRLDSISIPLINSFSYKTGESKKYSEGGPTWGKEAYVISMNPIYTTDGVDTNVLKIDYHRPGSGTTQTNPSSISITAKTNKKIDTSFWLEVRSVYTVWHTYVWETFSGSTSKTLYGQEFLDQPISIRVHVTKENEEGSVKVSYTDIDTGKSIINENILLGKIGTSYTQDVKNDYEAKRAYIMNQFYQFVGEKNTIGNYIDGQAEAEYQFERIAGGDVTVEYTNTEAVLNERQKAAFGAPAAKIFSGKYAETVITKAEDILHYETIDKKTEKAVKLDENPQQITFEYQLSQAKPLTVKYVDQDGKQIPGVDSKVVTGRWGDEYSITPREEIPFYTLIDSRLPIKGELTDEKQEITYHYQVSDGAPIIIHYLDEHGNKLKEDKKLTGLKYGARFTEKSIDIDHYRQKKDEIKGQVTDQQQDIVFVYEKNDGKPVKVDFKTENGNVINESYFLNGKYDESFDVSEKNKNIQSIIDELSSKHYMLLDKKGELTGKYTDKNSEKYSSHVTYTFKKKSAPGKVNVYYINSKNNKEISDMDILKGRYDEQYATSSKIIKGYHLTQIPTNRYGFFGDDTVNVVYQYEPDTSGTIQLHYIDSEVRNSIAAVDVKVGSFNEEYNFDPKRIKHHVSSNIPENAKGIYPEANEIINIYFEYDRAPAKPVHVLYQDEEKHEFEKEELENKGKKWQDPFETELKSFEGYEVKSIAINDETVTEGHGFYDDEKEQNVVYTYKLKKAQAVNVKYVDEETQKEINPQEIILDQEAVYGDQFKSNKKDIDKYLFSYAELNGVLQDGADVLGKYTDEQQTVVYYYKKDKSTLVTKNAIIYVGDDWQAKDNFISATDKQGKSVPFEEIEVTGSMDTSQEGEYQIAYSYDGISTTSNVMVKKNCTVVNAHDSTIYVGEYWQAKDNFNSAADKKGKLVPFENIKITGNVNTRKAGEQSITYSYNGVSTTIKVLVKEKYDRAVTTENENKQPNVNLPNTGIGGENIDKIIMSKTMHQKNVKSSLPKTGEKQSVGLLCVGIVTLFLGGILYLSTKRVGI